MKFTLSWLKDFLETDASVDVIADALNNLGLEVEDIYNPDKTSPPFPSMLVIFKRNIDKSIITWNWKKESLYV